jgi:hypothetical protein
MCHCAVCDSGDPKDNRLRPSILLSRGEQNVVIDTPRISALRRCGPAWTGWTQWCSPTDTPTTFWDSTICGLQHSPACRDAVYGNEETFRIIRRAFACIRQQ